MADEVIGNTRDSRQPSAGLIVAIPRHCLRVQAFDLAGERPQLSGNTVEPRPCMSRKPVLFFAQCLQRSRDAARSPARHDPVLSQVTAKRVISMVRCLTIRSRLLLSISTACCSTVFTATKRNISRVTASQIASASAASVFLRFTYGLT